MEVIVSEVLEKIKRRGLFQRVSRMQYLPYNMKTAMYMVEAIGKDRNPRFVIDDENRFAYENLIRWVHGDTEMKCLDPETKNVINGRINAGIYISGNTGSGKSWALEIMTAYCMIDNVQIKIGDKQRSLYWNNIRTDSVCEEYKECGTIKMFKKATVMGFQDLGTEPVETLYMGNRINVMKQILESRGDATDQITLITSNISLCNKQLSVLYDDRVVSRLHEMCNYFEIKGKDRRKI